MYLENISHSNAGALYYPGYFKISLLSEINPLNIESFDEQDLALLLHEYCHFVQDISTFYGLNNIIRWGELNHFYISYYQKNGFDAIVSLPEDVKNNIYISNALGGCTKEEHLDFRIADVYKEIIDVNPKASYNLTIVKIKTDQNEIFDFGSHAIMEAMAYIFERKIGSEKLVQPPVRPYRVVHKLWDFYLTDRLIDEEILFALCDLSLMHSEPGPAFIDYIEKLAIMEISAISGENLYKILNNKSFLHENEELSTFEMLNVLANLASIYVHGYFKLTPDGHPNHDLFKNQMAIALGYRQQHPTFLFDCIKDGKFPDNKEVRKLIDLVGSPLITNQTGHAYMFEPKNFKMNEVRMEFFWALRTLFNLKHRPNTHTHCDLFSFCTNCDSIQQTNYVDHNCLENVMERIRTENDFLCPLQYVIRQLMIRF